MVRGHKEEEDKSSKRGEGREMKSSGKVSFENPNASPCINAWSCINARLAVHMGFDTYVVQKCMINRAFLQVISTYNARMCSFCTTSRAFWLTQSP